MVRPPSRAHPLLCCRLIRVIITRVRAGDAFLLDARLELRAVRAAPPRTAASVHFRVRWLSPPFLSSIRHKIESQSTTSIGEAFRMCVARAVGCPACMPARVLNCSVCVAQKDV